MHNFLLYLLKSTLCISLLYLLFRIIMRKESFFALNRILLLTIVVSSAIIPLLYLPKTYQPPVQVELLPVFVPVKTSPAILPSMETTVADNISAPGSPIPQIKNPNLVFTVQQLLQYGYVAGFLFTLLFLVYSMVAILLLFSKARSIKMDGYRLLVIDREIAAFSFGRFVVLSQNDYEEHRHAMLAHEQAHIRLYHFFDLLLLETIRIFHWFNPLIHRLIRDMKEIHEFQADDYTLTKGIDETQYKLLIIQKGVGLQMFALANSFNHCQIKKRLVMMDKEKPGKTWSWKVATFLPLLALLLMAFGRKAESGPPDSSALYSIGQVFTGEAAKPLSASNLPSSADPNAKGSPGSTGLLSVVQTNAKKTTKQWSESDFLSTDGLNDLIKMGKIPNWKEPEFASFKQNGQWVTIKRPYFSGIYFIDVQIDSRSLIWMKTRLRPLEWKEFQDSISTHFDYQAANEWTKPYFHLCLVNGAEKMSPQCVFTIVSDESTPASDYQKFLNTIGNSVLEIRKKYSKEIYKTDYSQLNSDQKEQIDIVVPLIARFAKTPKVRSKAIFDQNSLYIEIKAEGIIISHETKTSSLAELRDKVGLFLKENQHGMISVLTASSSKEEQLEEVKEVLRNAKASNVNYSGFDPVYKSNEVDEKPQFSEGKLGQWIGDRMKHFSEGRPNGWKYLIGFNIVIDKSGKVINTEIKKGCDYPEINTEFKKVLSEMPEWKPGKKNGLAVNVLMYQAFATQVSIRNKN